MSKSLKVALGLVVSAGCLWLVFRNFDFNELWLSLRQAEYIWFIPAAIFFCWNMICRVMRWRILLSPIKESRFTDVFHVLLFGFFMNNIVPARGGELLRAMAADRRLKIPASSALGSIVVERLTDLVGLLMVILIATRLLPWEKLPIKPIAALFSLGVLGGLVMVVLMQKYGDRYKEAQGLMGKLFRLVGHVLQGFLALRSPYKMAMVIFLSCLIWFNEMLIVLFVSYVMHLGLNLFECAGLLTGLSVGVMIPAAPGYIGTYEFFGKEVLVMMGRSATQALPFVLVLHFFQLVMMAVLGIPSMLALQTKEKSQ